MHHVQKHAEYAKYATAFVAAGFWAPDELENVTAADVPGVPAGAVRKIARAGETPSCPGWVGKKSGVEKLCTYRAFPK